MKTSFYFVVWISIYPLLGLIGNSFIDKNSFLVALAVVWGLSVLLSRLMPATLAYEHKAQSASMLEDVYTGNVESFGRRLSRDVVIETVTAGYLFLSTVAIMYLVIKTSIDNWLMFGIFALFAYGAIARCTILIKAKSALKSDPTPKQCTALVGKVYGLDYDKYYNDRNGGSYDEMLAAGRPRHFRLFQYVSLLFAVAAILLGLYYIVDGISALTYFNGTNMKLGLGTIVLVSLLYGSLAVSFGIKDSIALISSLKSTGRQ